jgi:hypothetical protein
MDGYADERPPFLQVHTSRSRTGAAHRRSEATGGNARALSSLLLCLGLLLVPLAVLNENMKCGVCACKRLDFPTCECSSKAYCGFSSGGTPPSGQGEMFFNYIMIEAENDPANAPTLIWYNGGWCPIHTQFTPASPSTQQEGLGLVATPLPDSILVCVPP